MWDLQTGEKLARFQGGRKGTEAVHVGHCTPINAIAVSSDSQFLVSSNSNLLDEKKIVSV